ncbi:hypothetical protein D7X33_18230 [Butyricicoccus sp. 1XD8-22]|nr:hypothetical protein D7X33_18230 [Butyricicoccus sp. 1XD8-22]
MKTKIAQLIRMISLPAILALLLLSLLANQQPAAFSGPDFFISTVWIVVLPLLAYPLSFISEQKGMDSREKQRSLAFGLTMAGHTIALLYGIIKGTSAELRVIYWTYFLSILFLFAFNKLLRIRASAHAASVAGTLVLILLLLGSKWILPCIILAIAVAWASLCLKRHSIQELLLGAVCGIGSYAVSTWIVFSI